MHHPTADMSNQLHIDWKKMWKITFQQILVLASQKIVSKRTTMQKILLAKICWWQLALKRARLLLWRWIGLSTGAVPNLALDNFIFQTKSANPKCQVLYNRFFWIFLLFLVWNRPLTFFRALSPQRNVKCEIEAIFTFKYISCRQNTKTDGDACPVIFFLFLAHTSDKSAGRGCSPGIIDLQAK